MKLKEIWEKYQMAIAFAEAGETQTARHLMDAGPENQPPPARQDSGAGEQASGLLRPSTAEG